MNLVETGKNLMVQTGASAVLWLLVALSVISFAMMIERGWAFFRRRGNVDELRGALLKALKSGGFDAATAALSGVRHPAAVVALRGLSLKRGGSLPTPKEAAEAMEAERIVQKGILDNGLGLLATLGNNAPFVGLFGTVVGIVGAFDALGHGGMASGAAGTAGATQVMSAIGEALVATAVGIGVAIPAVASFNWFSRKTKAILAGSEVLEKEILAYLEAREEERSIEIPSAPHVPTTGDSGITLAEAAKGQLGRTVHGF